MKICAFLTVLLMLSGCGSGRYGSSYVSYVNPMLDPSLIVLQEGQEPNLVRSNDLDRDVRSFREHNYVVIGESSFNGISENPELALKKAKEVGATHVVASSQFTDTASYLAYDYQDYYRTAVVRRVSNVNGQRVKYYDTVTVRETVAIPYREHYNNYDQWAVYMVKSSKFPKLGLVMQDLNSEQRTQHRRNTGAYIDVVLLNSPAFIANIMPQDILISINGNDVRDKYQAEVMIDEMNRDGKDIVLTLLQNGKQKDITMEFVKDPVPDAQ